MGETQNQKINQLVNRIKVEVKKVIVEQDELIDFSLISLLSGGHVLIEGVPGLAKTLMVKALSRAMDLDFKRIQFTPDLMPADVTGTKIFNMHSSEFELKKGPIFTNLLLADEINRTPPKTQSGLLEAMAEGTVSIDGNMISLPKPFMVFATQNPLEYEGTYSLPEALIDRFIMKIYVDYPSLKAENQVLLRHHKGFNSVDLDSVGIEKVCIGDDILNCIDAVKNITVDDELIQYMVQIASQTRNHALVDIGSSPRGSLALLQTSKACAAIDGRDFVTPEDVKKMAMPTLRHRIILKPELEIEGVKSEEVIADILSKVKVPR